MDWNETPTELRNSGLSGTSENPGQNPAHDSFSALALSEVENCNNSDPEAIECRSNQDAASRKVFGECLLFHSLHSLNKSHISNFVLYWCKKLECFVWSHGHFREHWTFDSFVGLGVQFSSLVSATSSSPASLAQHQCASGCLFIFTILAQAHSDKEGYMTVTGRDINR